MHRIGGVGFAILFDGEPVGRSFVFGAFPLLFVLLYGFFIFLERRTVAHVYVFCFLQVLVAFFPIRLGDALALLYVCTALLLRRIARSLQSAQRVIFHFLVELHF